MPDFACFYCTLHKPIMSLDPIQKRNLFEGIKDEKPGTFLKKHGEKNPEFHMKAASEDPCTAGLSAEDQLTLMFVRWVFVHGPANLNNTMPLQGLGNIEIETLLKKVTGVFLKGFLAAVEGGNEEP